MKFIKYITCLLFSISLLHLNGQTKREVEELYKDANSYYYFEDYEEALALYLRVYNSWPDNYNVCYKIGVCYLNIPGYRQQSIPFLEKAAANTKKHYNEQSVLESKAPFDAVFYLGNAYFIANQLDKAQKEYMTFKGLIKNEKNWNLSYYDHQVLTLKKSGVIQSYPVNFLRNSLGEPINDRFANYNPIISGDESTLAFTTKQRFYQAIYVSRKDGDAWGSPINITLDLQVDGNCSTLSLSNDGNELYLFKDDSHDGNIYVTRFVEGRWSPMKKLNENINTKYYETHACISPDGKKFYFTSNRKGGYGDQDIYYSEREGEDLWGPAKNMGSIINSSMNENTPFITTDGNTLFFSSESHNTMGGYDVFYSQQEPDGKWSEPVNLGYPINTTDDDLFYSPIGDGSRGLIALLEKDGYGEQDIYQLDIFIPKYQKSILTSKDFLTITPDNRIRSIVIDTLNESGLALIDIAKSESLNYIDPKINFKLFFNGKEYDLRDQTGRAKTITAQIQQTILEEKIPTSTSTSGIIPDINVTEVKDFSTVQKRVDQLKSTADTTRTKKEQPKVESTSRDVKNSITVIPDKVTLSETNYLPEILTLLSTNHPQDKIVNALQQDWHFPSSLLKLRINQLTHIVDSVGNTEELLETFSKFIDLICCSEFLTSKNQSRTIAGDIGNQPFTHIYKLLIDRATPELAEFLEQVHQKNPSVSTFDKFWRLMKKEDSVRFKKSLPEIVKLLAEVSIETYIGLPEDQKYKLYEKITVIAESRSYYWFIFIFLGFALVGIAGYIYFRRRNE